MNAFRVGQAVALVEVLEQAAFDAWNHARCSLDRSDPAAEALVAGLLGLLSGVRELTGAHQVEESDDDLGQLKFGAEVRSAAGEALRRLVAAADEAGAAG